MADELKTIVRGTGDGSMPKVVGIAGVDTENPVIVGTMPVWKMIGVRVLRMYLQSFIGLLGVDALKLVDLAPPGDALAHLYLVGGIALAPTAVALLHNALEFLTKIDVTHPQLRA